MTHGDQHFGALFERPMSRLSIAILIAAATGAAAQTRSRGAAVSGILRVQRLGRRPRRKASSSRSTQSATARRLKKQ